MNKKIKAPPKIEMEAEAPAPQSAPPSAKSPSDSLSRGSFLKLMGASAIMASAACRRPVEQIVPALARAPETQPGIPSFYASVSPEGNGIIVRSSQGRPVKIAGNPDHPLSHGGLSASETASLMDLYDPDRQTYAAERDSKKTSFRRQKEEVITSKAQARLKEGSYVLLTGPIHAPSTKALIQSFLKKYRGGKHLEFRQDPSLRQIAEGQKLSYGRSFVPFYRFDRAEFILSIDGDFLGTMPLSTIYSHAYGEGRNLRKQQKKMNRLVVFESMYSLTGSNADERYAIRPGDQPLLALSLAAHIVIEMKKSSYSQNAGVRRLLKGFLPNHITAVMKHESGLYRKGYFERLIAGLAEELWEHRGRSLVLGASPLSATGSNSAAQISFNLLNSILGNDGKTIDHRAEVLLSPGASDKEIQNLVADLAAGKVKTLIFSNANLLYHLPPALKVKEALKAKEGPKYILSLNDRIDETGRLAHAILPTSHFLESWGDSQILKNLGSVQQPLIRPLYQTHSFEDRLIQLAGGSLNSHSTFYDFLKARWRSKLRGNFKSSWVRVLKQGYHSASNSVLNAKSAPSRRFLSSSLEKLPRFTKGSWDRAKGEGSKLYLGLYYNTQVGDGSLANNAYRQELPEPVTKLVWDNYLCLLPETARSMGLRQGSLVEITNSNSKEKLKVPVHLQPGLHPEAALLALGYGRSSVGKIAKGLGQNAMKLVSTGSDSFAFSAYLIEIKDTGKSYELASTQAIYGHKRAKEEKAFFTPKGMHELPYRGSSQHGRPILRETGFQEFESGKFKLKPEGVKYPKKQELTKAWNYEDTRWHMLIDLNSCTGCGACVTSCNSENNIPMVGKDEVKVGREMHWLRIDRYFEGEEENPKLAHQPMLCQHCENAPCENVCPVAATTHNSEGLNVMTYNRCIGTRYCANNCPYKVRRFNWFENWHYWEGFRQEHRSPQHLALNPNVTVRSRGVMEKCTFCVQRIAAARQDSKVKKEKQIPDGAVQTACQEVCPTQAITFGNILDPKSEVSKLKEKEKRGYGVLDFLGVKPQVTYLAKVRNKREQESS